MKFFLILWLATGAVFGQPMEVRIANETVPSGALVQLKVGPTEPHPITTGKMDFDSDSSFFGSYEGFALYSPAGDAAGVAVIRGTVASTRFVSLQGSLGTDPDYPMLMMAIRTRPGLPDGRTISASIDLNNSFWNLFGQPINTSVKPGVITISNTAPYVFDVKLESPTVLRITGGNFASGMRAQVDEALLANTEVLSPTGLRLTLASPVPMTGREIRLRNPDNQETFYNYYLRAVPLGSSTRPLLGQTVPIFPFTAVSSASVPGVAAFGDTFAGLALQNENFSSSSATADLLSATGSLLGRVQVTIPAGAKYVREISEMFGVAAPAGSKVNIAATAPLKIMGLSGNDSTSAVSPVAAAALAAGQLTFSPDSLAISAQAGGSAVSKVLALASTGPPVNYAVSSNAPWLSAAPSSGQTPADVTVIVNPSGLAVGVYSGALVLNGSVMIPVTMVLTSTAITPATITSPPSGIILGSSATFTWNNMGALKYRLDVGTSPGGTQIFSGETTATSLTVTGIPQTGGPVFAQLSTFINSAYTPVSPVPYGTSSPGSGSGYRFVPVTLCRLADTRTGSGFTGAFGAPLMAAGSTRGFPIPSGGCGIPSSALAYSLNITVVPSGPLSFLTAWPTGLTRPLVSTLNAFDGSITSNAAIIPAGASGSIDLFVTDPTDVIIDINGYFANTPQALSLYTVTPCRVVDTRLPLSPLAGPSLNAVSSRDFPFAQSPCLPAAADAYSLNVTVVPPAPISFLTAYPAGNPRPNVSTLNSFDGAIKANAAIVPAGTGRAVSIFATDRTDVVLDVNGYFGPPGGANGLQFYPLTPCRAADTRLASYAPALTAGMSRDFAISGTCGAPASARAYAMNVTVVPSAPLSFLTVWPAGTGRPLVSTLNSFAGKIVANAAIVPAGGSGAISVFATADTHVILDINGYFAP